VKKDKKVSKKNVTSMTIEHATALAIETREVCRTARQCLKELLEVVKKLVNNDKLTIQNLKQSLKEWLQQGWAIISDSHIQVTHSGRARIKNLATEAAELPLPA
jgi:coproporphyrinogen III oxidase-like Fe-S oxidoreductase